MKSVIKIGYEVLLRRPPWGEPPWSEQNDLALPPTTLTHPPLTAGEAFLLSDNFLGYNGPRSTGPGRWPGKPWIWWVILALCPPLILFTCRVW